LLRLKQSVSRSDRTLKSFIAVFLAVGMTMMTRRGFATDVVTFVVVATTAGPSRYALAKKDALAPLASILAKI
jgi:hypothetical protein